ncbi:uncharacterized protein [Drosophila pseudoobscura]|uniref:Uncharacterized protein n=1 Tax=Drosophila pseudoobscura pseudoobscura TaxID=46245 RepID=A0A6I8VXB7_DROPS|nr:uncharacterized protein LOC26534069 [Drosophila pseudoobscura]
MEKVALRQCVSYESVSWDGGDATRRCWAIVRLLIYRDNCQMTKWGGEWWKEQSQDQEQEQEHDWSWASKVIFGCPYCTHMSRTSEAKIVWRPNLIKWFLNGFNYQLKFQRGGVLFILLRTVQRLLHN